MKTYYAIDDFENITHEDLDECIHDWLQDHNFSPETITVSKYKQMKVALYYLLHPNTAQCRSGGFIHT